MQTFDYMDTLGKKQSVQATDANSAMSSATNSFKTLMRMVYEDEYCNNIKDRLMLQRLLTHDY